MGYPNLLHGCDFLKLDELMSLIRIVLQKTIGLAKFPLSLTGLMCSVLFSGYSVVRASCSLYIFKSSLAVSIFCKANLKVPY